MQRLALSCRSSRPPGCRQRPFWEQSRCLKLPSGCRAYVRLIASPHTLSPGYVSLFNLDSSSFNNQLDDCFSVVSFVNASNMYDSPLGQLVRRGVKHAAHKCGGAKGMKEMFTAVAVSAAPNDVHGHSNGHTHPYNDHPSGPKHPHQGHQQNPYHDIVKKLKSPGAMAAVITTLLALFLVELLISYTLAHVATNLAIAEESEASGAIQLPLDDNTDESMYKAPLLKEAGNGTIVIEELESKKPITASLRGTLRHLRSIGGFRSYFRGFHFALFYKIASAIFLTFFAAATNSRFIGLAVSSILTCGLHAAWTISTVAAPCEATKRGFFTRFLPRQNAKHLILPTLRYTISANLVSLVVRTAAMEVAYANNSMGMPGTVPEKRLATAGAVIVGCVFGLVGFFGAVLPAHIALIRSELALMPEDTPAVVSLDKTFGGRVNIEERTTGTWRSYIFHNMTMRGAYTTFDKSAYRRVVKMLVKTMLIQTVVYASFVFAMAVQIYVIFGDEVKDLAVKLRNGEL
jgi:hypothetical protein